MSLDQLWAHYISHGADVSRFDIGAFLQRSLPLPRFLRNLPDDSSELITDP